jgi:hypothetical protein
MRTRSEKRDLNDQDALEAFGPRGYYLTPEGDDDGDLFASVNQAALKVYPAVLKRLLPDVFIEDGEGVALNPRRNDRNHGSFRIGLDGPWADFAVPAYQEYKRAKEAAKAAGEKPPPAPEQRDRPWGGDPVSLVAYLTDKEPLEAAQLLARMLGVKTYDGGDANA